MTWHFSVSFFCNQKRLATIRGMAWNNQEFNDVYLEIEQQKHLPIELFLFAQKYLLNSFFVYCLASSASFYNSQYNTLPQSQKERKKFSTRDWKIKRVGASKKNSIKKTFCCLFVWYIAFYLIFLPRDPLTRRLDCVSLSEAADKRNYFSI